MKKKIIAFVSFVMICMTLIKPVYAKGFDVFDMNINVTLDKNGTATIEEKWDVDINEGTEIYKVFDNMNESKIKNLRVKDDQGQNYKNIGEWDIDASRKEKTNKCGLVTTDNGYELCFGIGEYGKRSYTFTYEVTNFVKQYKHDQGIYFAFFSDLSVEPRHVRITLSSPYELSEENSQIWGFGYEGNIVFENGKVVMEATSPVRKYGKMILLMRIDNGTFVNAYKHNEDFEDIYDQAVQESEYDDEMSPTAIAVLVGGAVTLSVIGAIFVGYFIKRGKQKVFFNDGIALRDEKDIEEYPNIPSCDMFEFYYLALKSGAVMDQKGSLLTAVILKWVQEGYITFEKKEEYSFFGDKEGFTVDLDKNIPVTNHLERKLLKYLKEAAGQDKTLETDEFEKWCQKNYETFNDWFEQLEEDIEDKYRELRLMSKGEVSTHYMGMDFKRTVNIYDYTLRTQMEQIIGFKKYLEDMQPSVGTTIENTEVWEDYLIYASILAIDETVKENIEAYYPEFNKRSRMDTYYTTRMAYMVGYHGASGAISGGMGGSSSFTGGGGGFSGGGGGGAR